MPIAPINLIIWWVSMTNDFKHQLRRAYTEPRYIQYLQHRFGWKDRTIEMISWKSLSIALRRIQRTCLCTKVCNDLLPTATTLKKRNYQAHDTCCLCGEQETRDHMLRCLHPSRHKWRIGFISALRRHLKSMTTKPGLTDVLCSTITEWFDTETVDHAKYHDTYQKAIQAQTRIGWRHIFTGHISQEWEALQGSTVLPDGSIRTPYVWSATLLQLSLDRLITLWETRNHEVHDIHNEIQNKALHSKAVQNAQDLLDRKHECRPSDQDTLFPTNVQQFLAKSTKAIKEWVTSYRRPIQHSITTAQTEASRNTYAITRWFRPSRPLLHNSSTAPSSSRPSWHRDRLVHDAYSKKRRHKHPQHLSTQMPIVGYLSLHNKI